MRVPNVRVARTMLLLLAAYLTAIFIVSHLPGAFWKHLGFRFWDKAAHFAEYVPVGFLFSGWLLLRKRRFPRAYKVGLITLGVVTLLAIGDETHQYLVPGRDASWDDCLADILGGGLGSLVGLFIWGRGEKVTEQ